MVKHPFPFRDKPITSPGHFRNRTISSVVKSVINKIKPEHQARIDLAQWMSQGYPYNRNLANKIKCSSIFDMYGDDIAKYANSETSARMQDVDRIRLAVRTISYRKDLNIDSDNDIEFIVSMMVDYLGSLKKK
jgi:hypothetical protein